MQSVKLTYRGMSDSQLIDLRCAFETDKRSAEQALARGETWDEGNPQSTLSFIDGRLAIIEGILLERGRK